ncbi:MAG TPA: hypothetical protein VGR89_03060, partial [Puia sp.]|nr:hypothetical protein [Puia sp.]
MQILGPFSAGNAFGTLFTPPIKPVGGYIRFYPFYISAVGGTGTAAVASADAPWNSVQNLFLRDPYGQPIIQADGYSLYLMDLYGGQSGALSFGNQSTSNPSYQAVQTSGNFNIRFHIPFEMDSSGYCSLPAMNAASQPSIWVQTNPSTVVYSTPPTGVPTLTFQLDEEFWAAPVDNPAFAPPDVGSSSQWSVTKAPTGIASNQFQRIVLPRVGALTTTLILILRDSTGARVDGYPPSDLSLWVDGVPHLFEMFNERADKMWAQFGVTRPAGVIVYTFRNSVQTLVSTADTYDVVLPTSPATLLEVGGTWGSGSGTVQQGGQGAITNVPAQLYQLTQELYPFGGIPYTHLSR